MNNLAIIVTVLLIFQMAFSFLQVRYYSGFIRKIAKKFASKKGYALKTQVAKNIFKSTIILVVVNEDNKIVEVYEYAGLTVFSKFKERREYVGQMLDRSLLALLDEKKTSKLKRNAFEKLVLN